MLFFVTHDLRFRDLLIIFILVRYTTTICPSWKASDSRLAHAGFGGCPRGDQVTILFLDNGKGVTRLPLSSFQVILKASPPCTLEVPHARPRDRKIRTKRLAFGGTA